MAQLTRDAALTARIDADIDYLSRQWEDLPRLADEWDSWDELSQLDFVIDWGVPADRLAQLRNTADQGLLTAEQRRRYEQLLQLVGRHQPLLDRILAD